MDEFQTFSMWFCLFIIFICGVLSFIGGKDDDFGGDK